MNEIEKIQGRALKRIFNVPVSTSYIGSLESRRVFLDMNKAFDKV